ncbi:glycosyltransferase family 2 protein [Bradyrhizobium tropiciagri]|uniref:glycosyltransferase family 2 protein n=1 Tax=Bradyrhizobium tropiciagri TaxID=312253 RepID=UPI001BA68F5F|nr:glycosyltransferase family 2 protein [Bradyrhizobium tropiciagri]MBR0898213.1 glycosyltransferase family 2 protein [Bradyrhizobium tropiciagri]
MSTKTIGKQRPSGADDASLQTQFTRYDRTTFSGFVYDRADLGRRYTVELLVDGEPYMSSLCDEFVTELADAGIGDGRFGFTFNVQDQVGASAGTVEARLANIGSPVGAPIRCDVAAPEAQWHRIAEIDWAGGLRFEGWLSRDIDEDIEILIAQRPVMTVKPTGWTNVARGSEFGVGRRIDFHLPEHFADGRMRGLSARTVSGRSLISEPIPFVAFERGLEQTLAELGRWESERLRGELFDRVLPASMPFHAYPGWKERFAPTTQSEQSDVPSEAAVVLIGENRVDESIESLEAQGHAAWSAVCLPTQAFSQFDPKAARDFVDGDAANGEFFVFCLSGTILAEDALQRFAALFASEPDCDLAYGDVEIPAGAGAVWPLAFSAFDLERALEQGYGAYCFAVRRQHAIEALRSATSLYDIFLSCAEPGRTYHLPGSIAALPQIDASAATGELAAASKAYLARAGIEASVEPRKAGLLPAVQVKRAVDWNERTTIIIPTRNRAELLKRCIETVTPAANETNARILVVDNSSTEPETLDYLESLSEEDIDVISVEGPFNFAAICNAAVDCVDADNICFLNNDIEALDDGWLAELLWRLAAPDVGAVGAKLLWPSSVVQHGGVVLGANFSAAHAFNDRMDGDPGYGDLLQVAHECSAVTAACVLMRKRDFVAVGGMDATRFPISFNDIDLCLKLRQLGKRIVFAADAKLVHLESASRGRDSAPDRKARFKRELSMLRAKWGEVLLDDPYYSPLLGLDSTPFSSLAWPPRSWKPRANLPPVPAAPPVGM